MDLRELGSGVNPADHWYYISKSKLLGRYASRRFRRVVDVGSGSGFFSSVVQKLCTPDEIIQVDPNFEFESVSVIGTTTLRRLCETPTSLVDADLVLLMDVLEHVQDPEGLLRSYIDRSGINCEFLITVPAFNFMWSDHDVFLGHYKRYRRQELDEMVTGCGLEILSSGYFFSFVFPIAIFQRKILGNFKRSSSRGTALRKSSLVVHRLLSFVCLIEYLIWRGCSKIPGLTVVVFAKKTRP